jgi:hypothetical protein
MENNPLQMVINSKETTNTANLKVKEDTNGLTEVIIKVTLRMDIEMVKVY